MDEVKITQFREDVKELTKLLESATRSKVKDILTIEIRKLETEISRSVETARNAEVLSGSHDSSGNPPISHGKVHHARFTKEITTYAWDQSPKFMKIYVDLKGIHEIPATQITTDFSNSSFKMKVSQLNGTDYVLHVGHLNADIVGDDSYLKVKNDRVLLMLKKAKEGETWPYVVRKNTPKETKMPAVDPTADPEEGLMGMMKKMYEDGDDEMKRTISKSWYEAQQKKGADPSGMGGMGGMGGMASMMGGMGM